jgi:hypothetical protein
MWRERKHLPGVQRRRGLQRGGQLRQRGLRRLRG